MRRRVRRHGLWFLLAVLVVGFGVDEAGAAAAITLISPSDGAVLQPGELPTFTFQASRGLRDFRLEMSVHPSFPAGQTVRSPSQGVVRDTAITPDAVAWRRLRTLQAQARQDKVHWRIKGVGNLGRQRVAAVSEAAEMTVPILGVIQGRLLDSFTGQFIPGAGLDKESEPNAYGRIALFADYS